MNKLTEVALGILLVLLDTGFVRATISGEQTAKILYVNNQYPQASDQNPGTEDLPLKTINTAAGIARQNQMNNIGTKIVIYPGTYRERIDLSIYGPINKDVPIIFEGKEKGKVIVSGSDIWNGWMRQGNTDIYTHPWPYKWGLAPYPASWERNVVLKPIVRRREMIFVNGYALEQVISFEELKEGRFYVSEDDGIVYIWLSPGTNINKTIIEVAVRSGLFYAKGKRNIGLRGLTFQHDNTPLDGAAVQFVDSSNILVEDSRFLWNNWTGLALGVSQSVTARRNVANHNGGGGMATYKIKTLLFEDNETSYNNWRGAKGGFLGWAVAGIKNMRIRDGVYRRHKSVGNQTRGFWLDFDNANILIEAASWCDNLTNGIFIEASQGPITIRDSLICRNRKYGIQTTNSSAVTLAGNTIRANGGSQIRVTGDVERAVTNWETGEQRRLKVEHWTLQENVIVGEDARQLLLDTPGWGHFLGSLASQSNGW
ncbi:MAG: right-handed parallel beta-helix repeat-containing protein, partial [Candidatus Entotheonellia bacterium]